MTTTNIHSYVAALRTKVNERREAHEAFRTLQRELATYRTPHEINDLLGVIKDEEGPEAQQIRDLLLR